MYVRNGEPFDINVTHVFDDIQYTVGWFYTAEGRARFGIEEVFEGTLPDITQSQKLVADGYEQDGEGRWVTKWAVVDKTADELAADVLALAQAKADKDLQINRWREQANFTSFPFAGKTIACDSLSRSDIDGVANHITLLGAFPANFPHAWKTTDNAYVPLPDIDAFKAMFSAMTSQGTANFIRSQELKAAVENATTLAAVEAVTW